MTDTDVRRIEDQLVLLREGFAELRGSLSPTLERLTDRQDDTDEIVKDHEKRIRYLERFRYAVPSVAFLALIATVWLGIHYH